MTEPDKTYYIFGSVNKLVDQFRKQINKILYIEKKIRNVKKYELLNTLVLTGLDHKDEVLDKLGLVDICEEDLNENNRN